ncbi:MAG: hypothetical protein H7Y89_04080 [Steroidobacteraceae bacterium]|nr:hypothetical protein [Steroidobacteraceae bacterium]
MLASLVDHLWQSILVFWLAVICSALSRHHSAQVRLWLWRIAAAKFLVPFAIFVGIGSGFDLFALAPDDPTPASLLRALNATLPLIAPARSVKLDGGAALAGVAVLLLVSVACGHVLVASERLERWRVTREMARLERDPDDAPPGLGLWRGALFTFLALCLIGGPAFAGAVGEREWRRELVLENARNLFRADVRIRPAAPGMGSRARLSADANGAHIRNATIQQLTGIAYGVRISVVWGAHRVHPEDAATDWFIGTRYDVDIAGPIREPEKFDGYALRVPITRALGEKYGLQIFQNSACQPPCGVYGVAIPEATP